MDLYMWELRLDKVEDKGGFHPLIHETARKVTEEHGVTVRNMRKQATSSPSSPRSSRSTTRLGAQLGFVPLTETEVALLRERPEAGPGRELGLDRRARRRGAGRGAVAARREPMPGAHERPPAADRLGEVPLAPAKDRRIRVFALGVKPQYQHLGIAAAFYIEHLDQADPAHKRSGGARWGGSSRPTRP